ncbi:bifunctional polynucleotide phosphatase/kinase-like [Ptychodera flava]|uniref:bifunctional polynucleotide phosphatase/kinase-like n=1 Tax=Ptychodera flava TaxID=63121 RepID=UPI003969EFC2
MPKRKSARIVAASETKKKKEMSSLNFDATWSWYAPGSKQNSPVFGDESKADFAPVIQLDGPGISGSEKIAGFDIDSTLITTRSGRKFATGVKDWQWWSDEVPAKLKEAYNDGFKIVFVTNQAGIEKNHVTPKEICTKCEDIINELGFPVQVFMSTGQNQFRKPSAAVFDHMEKDCNHGMTVNRKHSYYVGDAAGRAKEWAPGKKRDFSCGDRMFAANCQLQFYTPEEYFLNEAAAPFEWQSINPRNVLKTANDKCINVTSYHSDKQEMVIMVGSPAAGKSSFCKNFLQPKGYTVINRDTLGTQSKCKHGTIEALKAGQSVVIDNTNPAKYTRYEYIRIAEKYGVPIRCFWLVTSLDLAHHMNLFRQNQTKGKMRRVPDVAFHVFKKNFEEPDLSEGFSDIKKIDFVPYFAEKRDEDLFKQWTC